MHCRHRIRIIYVSIHSIVFVEKMDILEAKMNTDNNLATGYDYENT